MLYTTKPVADRINRILRNAETGRLSDQQAGEQLLAIDPEFPAAYTLLASAKAEAGDLEAAEALAWKTLDLQPCQAAAYLFLADIRLTGHPGDLLAEELKNLAFWKLSFLKKVPREIAGDFRKQFGKAAPGLDYSNPLTYAAIAQTFEQDAERPTDPEITARLLPYRLLNDVERQADSQMDERLIEEILAHAGECAPLLHSALREIARSESGGAVKTACMIAALLGETGGPECLPDLLEWSVSDDDAIFLHGGWAVWRLGRRFPAEAFEALRQAVPAADLPTRCTIAEHLLLLSGETDITPAVRELLEGFEKSAAEHSASHLLATVNAALRERGCADLVETLVAECAKSLPEHGREHFESMRGDTAEVLSLLSSEAVDQFDVNEVCLDRVLVDEEEGEEEEGEDEEDEDAPPAVKPGRNEPCWCGSGKKYKKCHLAEDEEYERQRSEEEEEEEEYEEEDKEPNLPLGDPDHLRLFEKVLEASAKKRTDLNRPVRLYFGEKEKVEEGRQLPFFEWYLRDYRAPSTGRTPVEEYLRRPGLPARDRQILEAWRDARFGLYEIQRIEEGTGVEVKDLCAGDSFFVHDVTTSHERVKWDCMLTRIEELDGKRMFSGAGILVPRPMVDRLLEWIETERAAESQSAAGFVRANSHRIHRVLDEMARDQFKGLRIVNAEGDPMEFCAAEYDVRDEAAAVEALRGLAELEPDDPADEPGVRAFAWLEAKKADPRRTYGHIEIRNGRLKLECNSRERLQKGRRLIEERAGSFLRHTGDSLRTLDSTQEQVLSAPRAPAPRKSTVPPEVEREVVLKLKQEHYATWADERLPALDGRTPREAVQTAEGRQAVENLLRMFENGEERLRKQGGPAFDFTPIRRELGLG